MLAAEELAVTRVNKGASLFSVSTPNAVQIRTRLPGLLVTLHQNLRS